MLDTSFPRNSVAPEPGLVNSALARKSEGGTIVKVYPDLVGVAIKKGQAAALALWFLARALDNAGAGRVEAEALKDYAMRLWSQDKFYRALREARALGLVEVVRRRRDGVKVVTLRGLLRVARMFGVTSLGAHPVFLRPSALRTAGTFRAAMFAAFQAGRPGPKKNPISRETLRSLTGVSRRTQPTYERRHNQRHNGQIKAIRNFESLGLPAAALGWAREYGHGACFLYGNGVVRPRPNSYRSTLKLAGRSRVKKLNRSLAGLVDSGAGQRKRNSQMYFDTFEQADEAGRHDRGTRGQPASLDAMHDRFFRAGCTYRGAGVWKKVANPAHIGVVV